MHSSTFFNILSLAAVATATAVSPFSETTLETRDVAIRTNSGFTCPSGMSYCPWTKACSCKPGMNWDDGKSRCTGTEVTGAWPKPSLEAYASVGIELGTFCAASPTKIVKYDSEHEFCQASLENVAFCAPKTIESDLVSIGVGVEIDLSADISADLTSVCAGLSGLYIGSVTDAVALFNTNQFGLGLSASLGFGGIGLNIIKSVKSLPCMMGLARCNQDCVSFCNKGCGNYLDVVGKVGGAINGLIGFCALPDVILTISAAGKLVSTAIEGLLCVVGNVLKSLIATFNCNCQ